MLDKITGEIRVYARAYENEDGSKRVTFSACVGYNKTEDEEYINWYLPVVFSQKAKDVLKKASFKLKDNKASFDVLIKDAWFTAYIGADDKAKGKLFINECKVVADETEEEEKKPAKKTTQAKKTSNKKQNIDEDDLPF